ncbi:MAG: SufD family Fe-S cluster assembly protein, partial [Kiritimatiellia bacterium]|nr:SufD family Fe-S cluster assembly protein [Kiritimatiellia bacterium]
AHLAFWNAGVRIIASPGCRLERGILIRGRADMQGSLWIARVGIEAGAGSRLGIAQVWESGAAVDSMVLAATRVRAEADAIVRGVSLQALGPLGRAVWTESLSVAERAEADWISLPLGGGFALNRIAAVAEGPGSNLRLRGLCTSSGDRHVDQKTLQDHRAPDTTSHLLFKSIVRDRARSVFRGVIRARPGALRIDAYQKNNNLVLDDGARADSLPGLLIDADDLKCTHGSTIGSLDTEALFYLRSRGLTEAAARALLIEGFTEDILGPIPWPTLREQARARIVR